MNLIRKRILLLIAPILVLGGIVGLFVFRANNSLSGKDQLDALAHKIEKHVILPKDEVPTLATIEDIGKVTDPLLKAVAQNGDKVLLYYKVKKVYVYRPAKDVVVDILPLILDPSSAQAQGARIKIRVGNARPETAEVIKQKISVSYKSATIQGIEPGARQDYPTTVVIDLTDGQKYDFVAAMTNELGAQRGVLPSGETKPDECDILIIVGTDKQ